MSKKIMFNDKYGLTQAVLEGRNTQTRRIITYPKTFHGKDVCGFYVCKRVSDGVVTDVCMYDENESFIDEGQILPNYKVGEIIAIAQSYKSLGYQPTDKTPIIRGNKIEFIEFQDHKGWNNKMFVKPNLMPHHIKINDVKVERLQDISDETSIKEGIRDYSTPNEKRYGYSDFMREEIVAFRTPREAFASLIDKVSGKGTWESNPYVFVYDFELVD